jgi:hypothetical protein
MFTLTFLPSAVLEKLVFIYPPLSVVVSSRGKLEQPQRRAQPSSANDSGDSFFILPPDVRTAKPYTPFLRIKSAQIGSALLFDLLQLDIESGNRGKHFQQFNNVFEPGFEAFALKQFAEIGFRLLLRDELPNQLSGRVESIGEGEDKEAQSGKSSTGVLILMDSMVLVYYKQRQDCISRI